MIGTVDLVIILLLIVGLAVIGIYMRRKISTARDFIVAGRSLAFPVMVATLLATAMGSGQIFGRAGYAYEAGAAMAVAILGYVIAMFIVALVTKQMEKHDVVSMPELFSVVFKKTTLGKNAQVIASIITFIYTLLILGLQFMAFGILFSYLGSPWGITPAIGAIIGATIAIFYTTVGGMFAVAWTDVIQFVLMIVCFLFIAPLVSINAVGGYSVIAENAAAAGISTWNIFTGVRATEIISLLFIGTLLNVVDPFIWQRVFSAKSMAIARKAVIVNALIGFGIAMTLVQVALAARILLPDLVSTYGSGEAALIAMVVNFFPTVIVGLMLAAILATIMSSADSYLLLSSNALIYDLVATLKPGLSQEKQVKMLRWCVFIVGAVSLFLALQMGGVFLIMMVSFSMYAAAIFVPALAVLYWNKTTPQAIIVSMIIGSITVVTSYFVGWFPFGLDPIFPAFVITLVIVVVISLMTGKSSIGALKSDM